MNDRLQSRRRFLKTAAASAGVVLITGGISGGLSGGPSGGVVGSGGFSSVQAGAHASESGSADYMVRIQVAPVEIAPKRIVSLTTYNGQFPGPLIRLKEGQPVTVDIINDSDVPEQLHWHGQMVPVDVDGASEEGTPYVPAHGKRRITFTPRPAG